MALGWAGELVRLMPLVRERHFDNALAWMNDPEVTQYLLMGDFPIGELAEKAFFDRMTATLKTDVAFAIETISGKHIGFTGLHQINFRHGFAISGTVIGEKEDWGKGYGKDAAIVRSRYAFEVLNLRMVLSECFEGNDRSLRMQRSVGYREYGICPKKMWKRGQYRDMIQTVLTREAWEEFNKNEGKV
jgi:RimJ/RimL family protein N-acetyltransferase